MGLFSKKECAICGGEIGLFGNRKLADGDLCKNCASKLSPFMTDRREATVEEIRRHLAYRALNERALRSVRPTRLFGHKTKVYVDDNARKFFVTGSSNWLADNPDVIDIDQVVDCRVEVRENRRELYRSDREGRRVSYNPPRYEYSYQFMVKITVNSPYFNEIEFELTDERPDSQRSQTYHAYEEEARELMKALKPAPAGPSGVGAAASVLDAMSRMANMAAVEKRSAARKEEPKSGIGAAMSSVKAAKPEKAAKAEQPKKWTCKCGSVNEGNFCPNCGAKRPVTYRCSKCGWVPEDPQNPPRFCPQCGDRFTADDKE